MFSNRRLDALDRYTTEPCTCVSGTYIYLVIIYINEASGIKYTDAQNVERQWTALCFSKLSHHCLCGLSKRSPGYRLLRATITRHEPGNERGTQVAKRTINFSPEREEDRRSSQDLGASCYRSTTERKGGHLPDRFETEKIPKILKPAAFSTPVGNDARFFYFRNSRSLV